MGNETTERGLFGGGCGGGYGGGGYSTSQYSGGYGYGAPSAYPPPPPQVGYSPMAYPTYPVAPTYGHGYGSSSYMGESYGMNRYSYGSHNSGHGGGYYGGHHGGHHGKFGHGKFGHGKWK